MRLQNSIANALPVVERATALPFPPVSCAPVAGWARDHGCVAELALEVWTDRTVNLKRVQLVAAVPHAFDFADVACSSSDDSGVFKTKTPHGLATGDGPFVWHVAEGEYLASSGQAGWFAIVDGDNKLRVATSITDALLGRAFTGTGAGPHVFAPLKGKTQRLSWHAVKTYEDVLLHERGGLLDYVRHHPRVVAYAIVGQLEDSIELDKGDGVKTKVKPLTSDASRSPAAISAAVSPLQDR